MLAAAPMASIGERIAPRRPRKLQRGACVLTGWLQDPLPNQLEHHSATPNSATRALLSVKQF